MSLSISQADNSSGLGHLRIGDFYVSVLNQQRKPTYDHLVDTNMY